MTRKYSFTHALLVTAAVVALSAGDSLAADKTTTQYSNSLSLTDNQFQAPTLYIAPDSQTGTQDNGQAAPNTSMMAPIPQAVPSIPNGLKDKASALSDLRQADQLERDRNIDSAMGLTAGMTLGRAARESGIANPRDRLGTGSAGNASFGPGQGGSVTDQIIDNAPARSGSSGPNMGMLMDRNGLGGYVPPSGPSASGANWRIDRTERGPDRTDFSGTGFERNGNDVEATTSIVGSVQRFGTTVVVTATVTNGTDVKHIVRITNEETGRTIVIQNGRVIRVEERNNGGTQQGQGTGGGENTGDGNTGDGTAGGDNSGDDSNDADSDNADNGDNGDSGSGSDSDSDSADGDSDGDSADAGGDEPENGSGSAIGPDGCTDVAMGEDCGPNILAQLAKFAPELAAFLAGQETASERKKIKMMLDREHNGQGNPEGGANGHYVRTNGLFNNPRQALDPFDTVSQPGVNNEDLGATFDVTRMPADHSVVINPNPVD